MCEGNKCGIGNQIECPKEIMIFTAEWCGACKRRVPQIMKKAQAAGLKVNLIDIDNVDLKDKKKLLKRVEFVPHIDYMGKEIDEEDLDQLAKKTMPKED
jgi:thiol-disulfide isomerase/thioredoxin